MYFTIIVLVVRPSANADVYTFPRLCRFYVCVTANGILTVELIAIDFTLDNVAHRPTAATGVRFLFWTRPGLPLRDP